MGSSTLGLINEAVRVAELFAEAEHDDSREKHVASLTQISAAATTTRDELSRLQTSMNRGDKSAIDQIQNELELMQRTVKEMKKVV
jgi:archaellum component FlaC